MRCDEGYLCDVCKTDVESITDSDLYLRYILGEVPLEQLHLKPERHILCHAALAQYIVDARFEPMTCEGFFDKRQLDPAFVHEEEVRVTLGWRRLQRIPTAGVPILEYPNIVVE